MRNTSSRLSIRVTFQWSHFCESYVGENGELGVNGLLRLARRSQTEQALSQIRKHNEKLITRYIGVLRLPRPNRKKKHSSSRLF